MNSKLNVVGLTGGIASGKTTVAKIFRNAGIPVLDADVFGHMVLEPDGLAYDDVIDVFGGDILDMNKKTISHQKLGKKIFDNSEARKQLEAITHPAIGQLVKQGLELIAKRKVPFAIYEAALLVETGIYKNMQALVVVAASIENQLIRTCARDNLIKEAAVARIASQLRLEEKIKVADYVIENNSTLEDLENNVVSLITEFKTKFSQGQF